jgi:hypothetical protein
VAASLVSAIALYAALLGAWAAVDAVRGHGRRRLRTAGLGVLQVALTADALGGAIAMLAGRRPPEPFTHAGYLVASVLVLPLVLGTPTDEHGRWDSLIAALACLAVLVVALRLQAAWGPPA